jgi:hypothetical protein
MQYFRHCRRPTGIIASVLFALSVIVPGGAGCPMAGDAAHHAGHHAGHGAAHALSHQHGAASGHEHGPANHSAYADACNGPADDGRLPICCMTVATCGPAALMTAQGALALRSTHDAVQWPEFAALVSRAFAPEPPPPKA